MLCREQLLIPVQEIIRSNIFAKCVAFWVDCRAEEGRVGGLRTAQAWRGDGGQTGGEGLCKSV